MLQPAVASIFHWGISSVLLMATTISVQASVDYSSLDATHDELPMVLTAVRLKQFQADVPASVTVLEGQTLVDLGIKDLSEAFRLVPGMMVGYDENNDMSVVHYHGGPANLPRNLQVLLDGRSMYRASLASVEWHNIPVAIEDIDRIEVVRGPNASSYGTNAYQAIVNILTKHPADMQGSRIRYRSGENGERRGYVHVAGNTARTDYSLSLASEQTDGFEDHQRDEPIKSQFADVKMHRLLADDSEMKFSATYQEGNHSIASTLQAEDFEFESASQSVKNLNIDVEWEKLFTSHHKIKSKFYTRHSDMVKEMRVSGDNLLNVFLDSDLKKLYSLNPSAAKAFVAQKPVQTQNDEEAALVYALYDRYITNNKLAVFKGKINNNVEENRIDFEIEDTLQLNDLTFNLGTSYRRDEIVSKTFFDGKVANEIYRVFGATTWQVVEPLRLHLSFMSERENHLGVVTSPRAAINYRLNDESGLRAVYSESVRSPDLYEQAASWNYQVSQIETEGELFGDTYFVTAESEGGLKRERIRSSEIGYYGLHFNQAFELDVKIFHEQLSDILDQNLALENFENENRLNLYFRGIESQLRWQPFSATQLRATGAYIDAGGNDKEDILLRVYAKNTYSFAWIQQWPKRVTTSTSYYLADAYNVKDIASEVARYERIDAHARYIVPINQETDMAFTLSVQRDLNSEGLVFDSVVYRDETRFIGGVSLQF